MKTVTATLLSFAMLVTVNVVNASPTVYIPLGSGNRVIAVDAASDKITGSYPDVINAHGLVATPNGEYLVAGSLSERQPKPDEAPNTPNSQLFLIHPVHGHVMATIPVVGWTHHLAITPDGRYVVSTHPLRGDISVVDLLSNKVEHTIKTGNVPNYTVITRDGKTAYVSNTGSNNLVQVDLTNWKVTRTLESGPTPEHLVFSPDEKTIFVANTVAGTVSAVSVKSGKVSKTYKIGAGVHGLDISDDGNTLFVTSKKDEKFVALDIKTGKERVLALSPAPYHLNTITGTGKVYVSSSSKPVLWVVDQKSIKVIDTIQLPAGEGHQMAIVNE